MYTSFRVQNFRCFEDLTLDNLGRVNLLVGKNNTGKTSVLDAIAMHNGKFESHIVRLQIGGNYLPANLLFHATNVISIGGMSNWNHNHLVIQKTGNQEGFVNLYYGNLPSESTNESDWISTGALGAGPNAISEEFIKKMQSVAARVTYLTVDKKSLFGHETTEFTKLAVQHGKRTIMVEVLQILDAKVRGLEILVPVNVPLIYVNFEDITLPISVLGEGMKLVLNFILAIGNAENGIVLIDEIENGLHYSVQKDVWRAIGKATRDFNVQLFATTHSLECIRAAHAAFRADGSDDLRVHRLQRGMDGNIRAVTYDAARLDETFEADFEVR